MKYRLGGLLLLLLSVVIGYFAVYAPLHDAALGAKAVRTSLKGTMILPLCALMGLGLLTGGQQFYRLVQNDPEKAKRYGKASLWGWIIFIIGFAMGFGLHEWEQQQLAILGYVSSY